MRRLYRIGGALYLLPGLIFILIGLRSMFQPGLMSHHATALGIESVEQMHAGLHGLYFALRYALGGAFLGSGIAMFALYVLAFRNGSRWASHVMAAVGLAAAGPLAYAAYLFTMTTPGEGPVIPVFGVAGVVVVAWISTVFGRPG